MAHRWPRLHRTRTLGLALAGLAVLEATACVSLTARAHPSTASRAVVHVQNRWLALRVSQPATAPGATRPFVFFITGDGGWRGKDLDAFDQLRGWGYAVAGISAPDYLGKLAKGAEHIPPQVLADDLAAMVAAARGALGEPAAAPVLLFGISRGADLAVVAAARPSLASALRGVLAVGLTAEEEYVHVARRGHRKAAAQVPGPAVTGRGGDSDDGGFDDPPLARPYAALRRVPVPVSLIQSTHDEYVPAAEARRLFGPDAPGRQLHAITARDHSFSDARTELYGAMRESLAWVERQGAVRVAQLVQGAR